MPREKRDFPPEILARMRAGERAGKSAKVIAAELTKAGVEGASAATVSRRLRELRGQPAKLRTLKGEAPKRAVQTAPTAEAPPLPETPEDIPDGTDVSTLDHWIEVAKRNGATAETEKNLAGIGAMGRLVATLLEHRRKATPDPKPDPNEHPDMVAAAKRAREDLHTLISTAVGRE